MKITINLSAIIGEKDQQQAYQAIKDQFEPAFLTALLSHTDSNKIQSAKIAGFNVSTLNKKLKRHGLYISKQVSVHGGSSHE